MFKIGETVFCPLRGSGIIEGIEVKTMLDNSEEYAMIHMKSPDVMMMIPTARIDESGFRVISDEETANKTLELLEKKEVEIDHSVDTKQRVKSHQVRLASGCLIECGALVRDLGCMDKIKSLSASEKATLLQAKRLLADELSIIKQISDKEAINMIDELLEK